MKKISNKATSGRNYVGSKKELKDIKTRIIAVTLAAGLLTGVYIYQSNQASHEASDAKETIEMIDSQDKIVTAMKQYESLMQKQNKTRTEKEELIAACETIYENREYVTDLYYTRMQNKFAKAYNTQGENAEKITITSASDDGKPIYKVDIPTGATNNDYLLSEEDIPKTIKNEIDYYSNMAQKNAERDSTHQEPDNMSDKELKTAAGRIIIDYSRMMHLSDNYLYLDNEGKLQCIETKQGEKTVLQNKEKNIETTQTKEQQDLER